MVLLQSHLTRRKPEAVTISRQEERKIRSFMAMSNTELTHFVDHALEFLLLFPFKIKKYIYGKKHITWDLSS